ncbi:hypothetical protein BDV26DRAFT_302265 [Aspergillus bertholletiae]|uniref:Uncharacterized protein n=1 Tax=Aspergillus bertholletiae TaxID=1226010 RepID=A0A5N7AQB2_9EURO|nr:hypothetical protein BDV26DRAFT_302265 [Aspergillus bertholletiae]
MDANSISITKSYSGQNDSLAGNVPATASARDSNRRPAGSALKRLKLNSTTILEDVDSQMEQQLENAQQRIQKSMPDCQLNDATISENYLVFRDSLCEWIEGFPNITSFAATLFDAVYRRGIDENILTFHRKFQLELDHAQTEVLICISFRIIRKYMVNPRVFAAPPAVQELLENLYEMMSMLKPKKVRAYTGTQLYKDMANQDCTPLADYLRGFFNCFHFEETFDWRQKFRRLEQQTLPQIAALVLKLARSHEKYQCALNQFILMDAHTHHLLNPKAAKFANMQDDAPIGVVLLVLYPALFRVDSQTQNSILIQQAVAVMQGYESLPSTLREELDSLATEG